MNSDVGVTLAYATFPDAERARAICTTLVDEGVIRCANVLAPHASIYAWEGEVRREPECAAILKLATVRRADLVRRFGELHPYDVPALVFLAVDGGSPAFLDWLRAPVG